MWRNIWGPVVPGQHESHHSRFHRILSGCWRLFWLSAKAARFPFISRTMTGHRDMSAWLLCCGLSILRHRTNSIKNVPLEASWIVNNRATNGIKLIQTSICFHSVGFHQLAAAVWFSPTRQRRQIQLKVVDCELTTEILCDTLDTGPEEDEDVGPEAVPTILFWQLEFSWLYQSHNIE